MNKTASSIEIQLNIGTFLIDYQSVVAHIANDGTITLGKDWDYSSSTKGKVAKFLAIPTKQINQQIKDNSILIDPNLGRDV